MPGERWPSIASWRAAYHTLVRYDEGTDTPLDKAEEPQEDLQRSSQFNLKCDFQRFITISSQPRPRFNLDSNKREGYGILDALSPSS
jgi:hypothetical protein